MTTTSISVAKAKSHISELIAKSQYSDERFIITIVQQAAKALKITLEPLPAYSPDFMPVEHLWQWLREDVTYHACYQDECELIAQVENFQQEINLEPTVVADRLWTKTKLDLEEEELRFST